jgi:hypothetical protein
LSPSRANKARTAALVVGIAGGVIGLLVAVLLFLVTDASSAAFKENLVSLVFSVLGIVGSTRVKGRPRAGGALVLISGVAVAALGGLMSVPFAYIVPGPFLIIGGLLSISANKPSAD